MGVEVCEDRFFLGFGREVGQEVNVILGKCTGRGVETVNFFSIDCKRSTVYIYFGEGVLCWKKKFFFFFLGFRFVPSKGFVFVAFFFLWLSWDHMLFHFGFFPIFFSFFFSSIFSSTSKKHFFPFFHPPLFYRNPLFSPFSIFFFLPKVSYRFFCRISRFYSFIYFYLFVHFRSFIFLFLFFSICRSIFSSSFDPFLGFARGTDE